MFNMQQMKKLFQKIQVVRSPKHRLSTFGDSRIQYRLVTEVPGLADRSRLRVGIVTAQKPTIITAQAFKDQFQGFGDDVRDYVDTLISQYGKALRGLEYQFKNEMVSTHVELTPPEEYMARLTKEFDRAEEYNQALIKGTDKTWELSIMKFIVEETMASFQSNVQELQDRGFFDGDERIHRQRRREIETLLKVARKDRSAIPVLGAKLKQYALFEKYQDAFFQLVNK